MRSVPSSSAACPATGVAWVALAHVVCWRGWRSGANSLCLARFYTGQGLLCVFSYITLFCSRIRVFCVRIAYINTGISILVCMCVYVSKKVYVLYINMCIWRDVKLYLQAEMGRLSDEALFQCCCLLTGKLAEAWPVQGPGLPLVGTWVCTHGCWYCY